MIINFSPHPVLLCLDVVAFTVAFDDDLVFHNKLGYGNAMTPFSQLF
jgi:hypothetical protein